MGSLIDRLARRAAARDAVSRRELGHSVGRGLLDHGDRAEALARSLAVGGRVSRRGMLAFTGATVAGAALLDPQRARAIQLCPDGHTCPDNTICCGPPGTEPCCFTNLVCCKGQCCCPPGKDCCIGTFQGNFVCQCCDPGVSCDPIKGCGNGAPSPKPILGRAVNVAVVSGQVLVKLPGQRFVPVSSARQIPVGSFLDTTRGTVRLTSAANSRGAVQSGDFSGGVFQVAQSRSGGGLTDLNLSGGSFGGCAVGAGRRAVATRSSRVVRRLRGNARGRFRTRGRYSAATVRGTNWSVEDRCDGTLTRVVHGVVAVRDFRKRRNVTVRAGKSYLARAG